jgi:hypothetical protein
LAGALDGLADAGGDLLGERTGKLGLEPCGRAEVVEQIGVGLADPRRDRLEGHCLRASFDQQGARGVECGGPAFLRAKAFASY